MRRAPQWLVFWDENDSPVIVSAASGVNYRAHGSGGKFYIAASGPQPPTNSNPIPLATYDSLAAANASLLRMGDVLGAVDAIEGEVKPA